MRLRLVGYALQSFYNNGESMCVCVCARARGGWSVLRCGFTVTRDANERRVCYFRFRPVSRPSVVLRDKDDKERKERHQDAKQLENQPTVG